jgi:hypothetical protein
MYFRFKGIHKFSLTFHSANLYFFVALLQRWYTNNSVIIKILHPYIII